MNYTNIDMIETGQHIKKMVESKGYTVKQIQETLHLSCPQPVYRWYKGTVLPSIDHLYMLSRVLDVHMEELLVSTEQKLAHIIDINEGKLKTKRSYLLSYYERVS
ncbi:MAG: helix-turn-helix transcriptional regulator [Eubacteriales bacterium]